MQTTSSDYQQLFNQAHIYLHSCPLKIISITAKPSKSDHPQSIVDVMAHLLYNPTIQESPLALSHTLLEPCPLQSRQAITHADYSALMSPTDHQALTLAVADMSKPFPASTLNASHTIMSQLHNKLRPRIALFTAADTPAQPAPLTQLSSKYPTSLYSYPETLSLVEHLCFITRQHQLHHIPPPDLTSLTTAMDIALHSFLKHTLHATRNSFNTLPPTLMTCPDHPLKSNPTFTSQTLLVSNLFTGEVNRPLQLGDMIKVAKNLNIELDIADLMKQFESGPVLPTTSLLLPFHESHAMLLKLRKPITVSDFHDPNENTYPPD